MMETINFLLNLLGWFLWAVAFVFPRYAIQSSQPLTLLSTLRSETPRSYSRLAFLTGLGVLLMGRALVYWNFSSVDRALPSVDFGILSVSFQTDSLLHMGGYSFCSFLVFLYVYYLFVMGLSMTCRHRTRVDTIENLVNQQLGAAAYWHPGLKGVVSITVGTGLWVVLGLMLLRMGVLPSDWTLGVLLFQSPLVAVSLAFKFVLVILVVIGLYFLNSYVYMGERVIWGFIDQTAKSYLCWFRKLPLLVGRFDFAPILGFLAYWLLYQVGEALFRLLFERLPGRSV